MDKWPKRIYWRLNMCSGFTESLEIYWHEQGWCLRFPKILWKSICSHTFLLILHSFLTLKCFKYNKQLIVSFIRGQNPSNVSSKVNVLKYVYILTLIYHIYWKAEFKSDSHTLFGRSVKLTNKLNKNSLKWSRLIDLNQQSIVHQSKYTKENIRNKLSLINNPKDSPKNK